MFFNPQKRKDKTMPVKIDHAPLVYTPKFWDPNKAFQNYSADVQGAALEGALLKLEPAAKLEARGILNCMMITDGEEDFRDKGRLPVKGMDADVLRTCVRIINGIYQPHYTGFIYSLDQHPPFHISSGLYWYNKDGNPMDLSTYKVAQLYEVVDRKKGIFRARVFELDGTPKDIGYYKSIDRTKVSADNSVCGEDVLNTLDYFDYLQRTGQGPIWVFCEHCKIGTDGMMLHPLLQETLAFACAARKIQPQVVWKGHIANIDWFGPFEPCKPTPNHPDGQLQKHILDGMKRFSTVEFVGWANDFCNYFAKKQVMDYLVGTEYLKKLAFVEDCTSSIIPGSPHVEALNQKARDAQIRFINHDNPIPSA